MTEPINMTAEELRAALAAAGVPVAATIEPRGGAMKLAEYWTHGPGAAKIRWGTDGDFKRCVMHLGKYVRDAKGLCNEYHQLALGAPPGKGHAAAAEPGVLRGVELARTGKWHLSTGETEFTRAKFQDAVDFYQASGQVPFPVKLGHLSLPDGFAEWDGMPAFGLVENPRINPDDPDSLLGDLVDLPGWLHAAAPRSWPSRSIEAFEDVDYKGRTYSMALTGLALLGVTPPGVRDVQSLRDLQVAVAATAGSRFIAATAPEPEPDTLNVQDVKSLIDDHVDRFIVDELNDPPTLPDPGTEASPLLATTPPTQEGAGMDPAKLREAVGALKPDASEEEVMAALASAGLKVAASAPPSNPPPQPAPSTPANPTVDPADQPDQTPANPPSKPTAGTVVMDSSQLEEFHAAAAEMRALKARIARDDRDKVIDDAIRAGKFPHARRSHWERAWDGDPVGTKATIESLAANLVPIAASGYAGDPDMEFNVDFASLYPPEVKSRG